MQQVKNGAASREPGEASRAPDQKTYFAMSASWAQQQNDSLLKSRRLAWIIASAATVVAVGEALALSALAPLKTVIPYTLLVDRQTGFVQALKPLEADRLSPDRALTQSFLVQYVIAREGFDYDTIQSDYQKVALWSAGQAREDYLAAIQASNPASPLNRLPRDGAVDVSVKSVTPLADRTALVRYDTRQRGVGGAQYPSQAWVAVLHYAFSGEPMSAADRFVNPLGFQVLRFHRSQEVLAPATTAMPTAAPVPASPPTVR